MRLKFQLSQSIDSEGLKTELGKCDEKVKKKETKIDTAECDVKQI